MIIGLIIGSLLTSLLAIIYHKHQIDKQHRELSEEVENLTTEIEGKIERDSYRREFDRPIKLEEEVDKYAKRQIVSKHTGVASSDVDLQEITFDGTRFIVKYSVDLPTQ
jgi:type III secretory pathway component EscU